MASRGCGTPWRQGHVLTEAAAIALNLIETGNPKKSLAVVVSHDCDLAQGADAEPVVEVIVGKCIETVDGNYTHAKSSRRLHLTLTDGCARNLDLFAKDKRSVSKEMLADYAPAQEVRLTPHERQILQRWLAARYRRPAFPDAFEARLRETGLLKEMEKILKSSSDCISAVLFDIDGGQEKEHTGADDPYVLEIYLLYDTAQVDPLESEEKAMVVASRLEKAFRDKCLSKQAKQWQYIELTFCAPISSQAMSIYQRELLQKWHTDHLSLRLHPPYPMLSEQ